MTNLIKILSIDGGGIRGILPGQILISLEKKLQQKSKNPNARIADFFDLIAGTSTGGILSCLYLCPDQNGKPRFSAEEAVNLYLQNGGNIFKKKLLREIESLGGVLEEAFDAAPLETCLQKYFTDIKLSRCIKHCLITAYDIHQRAPFFFRQRKAKENPDYDFLLWQVARSTSAAPTYFEPSLALSLAGNNFPLVDGGVFANNPTLCAYAEARQIFESGIEERKISGKKASVSEMFILSIGTGTVKVPYEYDHARKWGLAGWARPIIDIMMSGVADTVDYQLQQIFEAVGHSENYIRLSPDLAGASEEMSNVSSENLLLLKNAGTKAALTFDAQLERASDILCESKNDIANA